MKARGFTLVEIMIVVGIIGLLLAIAIPSFSRSRAQTQVNSCITNLRAIDGSKARFALENNKVDGDPVLMTDLTPFILKKWPSCPASGTYTINVVGTDPLCSIGGLHTL